MNWRVSKIVAYTLGENLDGIQVEISDDRNDDNDVKTEQSQVYGFSEDKNAEATKKELIIKNETDESGKDICISGVTVDHVNSIINALTFHYSDGTSTERIGGSSKGEESRLNFSPSTVEEFENGTGI